VDSPRVGGDLFKPGDLIEVAIVKLDEATKVATVTLDQTPNIEGALLAIEIAPVRSGDAGWLELQPQQVQPRGPGVRQLGSTFKPIVYTAAIDRGFTPTSILLDARSATRPATGRLHPHNYDTSFEDPLPAE